MGGEERVRRQHEAGRMTVRERIERLLDPGTFDEIGALAGFGQYATDGSLDAFTPANLVAGTGRIEGRHVVVCGDDFTVRGGAADASIHEKQVYAERMANELRLPLVRLVDGTGGGGSVKSYEKIGRTYVPANPGWDLVVDNLGKVPVVAACLGPVAGLGAARVVSAHFSVMVRELAQLFVAGPPVVAAGMGRTVIKEELGGCVIHTRQSGAVDNLAETEAEALDLCRRFLGYLPANVWQLPPVCAFEGPVAPVEELREIVPRSRRQPYDVRRILGLVFDAGSVFEIAPGYGRSCVTALARLGGRPVAVLASDPKVYGGGCGRQDGALGGHGRHLPSAGREHRGSARLRDRGRGRAGRHHPARSPRPGRGLPGHRALGVGDRAQGLRGGRGRTRQRAGAQLPLRLALGRLGFAAG